MPSTGETSLATTAQVGRTSVYDFGSTGLLAEGMGSLGKCDAKEVAFSDFGFVPQGEGSPTGLTVDEQIEWAFRCTHVLENEHIDCNTDLRAALDFELAYCAEEIDGFRSQVAHRIFRGNARNFCIRFGNAHI